MKFTSSIVLLLLGAFSIAAYAEDAPVILDENWDVITYCHEDGAEVKDQYILFQKKKSNDFVVMDKVERKQFLATASDLSFSWDTAKNKKVIEFEVEKAEDAVLSLQFDDGKITSLPVQCHWE